MEVEAALNKIEAKLKKLNRAELKKLSKKLSRMQSKVLKLMISGGLGALIFECYECLSCL